MRRPLRALAFLIAVAFPFGAVVAADIPVVPLAEQRLERAATGEIEAESVDVDLQGFPVVARALVQGEVAGVRYRWDLPRLGELRAYLLEVSLTGVGVARRDLLNGEVRIRGVESGELEVQVPLSEIARLLDRDVRIHEGNIVVSVTPASDAVASVSASADGLVLTAGPLDPVVADFGEAALPCAPRVTQENSVTYFRCGFQGLPPLFRS